MTRLSPAHLEELNSSRISAEYIETRQYQTLGPEHRETLVAQNIPRWAVRDDSAFPGLLVPLYDVKTGSLDGFQFKPAVPQAAPGREKASKYVSQKGRGNRLDVHPLAHARVHDPAMPLWITEGMKKADSLASRGCAVIGLTGVWNWRQDQQTLAEWEDVPLKGRIVTVCFDADALTNPQVRHAMNRLVGWLRKRVGAEGKVYYLAVPAMVGETPVKGVDDFFAAGGTPEVLRAAASERPPLQAVSADASFTDAFLTDTVASEALAGRYLYTAGLGWMRYQGNRWAEVNEAAVVEEIRTWSKLQWDDVVEQYKSDQSREVKDRMENWRRVLTSSRLKALASLSRGPLLQDAAAFDAHPDLLNCPNGVVDLRTGELLEPDPAYLMTKVTRVAYDPAASSRDFDTALTALPGDVRDWYQVRIGQAFTGHMTSDDLMIVQQGGGKNGKSSVMVAFQRAAGSYFVLLSDRAILGNHDQHPTELMDLKGARIALMEETPEARQLNVQQLKKVVGTPQITARRIRQDSVTFDASHSLFVSTNFPPAVAETDHGTWRRLAMLRFPYTYRMPPAPVQGPMDRVGDPGLRDRLKTEEPGQRAALAWAVRGAVQWYASGFPQLPARVVADTDEWRMDGDLILSFASQCLEFSPEYGVKLADLFQAFGQWLLPTGHKPWTQKTFQSRLISHDKITDRNAEYGIRRVDGVTVRSWWGVRVRPGMHQSDQMTLM